MRRLLFAFVAAASVSLVACGGGSGSSNSIPNAPSPQGAAKHLVVAVTGLSTASATRRAQAVAGTNVSVTLNGKIVGSGQLDSTGKVAIRINDDVPAGSMLLVTAGAVAATIVWNQTQDDAAVLIHVNADGTLTVTVASGDQPEENPAEDDPNGSENTEHSDGSPISVNAGDHNGALPPNLPITVSSTCSTVTVTPHDAKIASIRFEENVRDEEGGSKLKFEGPFTAAMTFPLVAQSARLEIRLFDASRNELLDVKAPVNAFTAQPGQATPAPCPTTSAMPSVQPSESPEPSPSPSSTP